VTRLKLRDDAYYIPTDDGICFLTDSGEVMLTGASIFQWVDRLAPYLDGRYTLAELTASMPAERRRMTERVITTLRERRVVVDVAEVEAPEPLTDRPVLLAGTGRMLMETAEAARCAGARLLRVVRTGTELSGARVVLYAGDRAAVAEVRRLDRACRRAGIPFVATILAGEEAWLGPFGSSGGDRPDWMSGWRRLRALNHTAALDGDPGTGAAPAVVANQFIRAVERLRDEPAGPPRMTSIELRSLRTRRHDFLPHPFALPVPDPTAPLSTVDRLRYGERIDPEEFSRRVVACLEPRLGVLGEVTEWDFVQIPLAVSRVQVSDPVLLLDSGTPRPVVFGTGLSHAEARRNAALRGLATYGSLMVDPRRLHVQNGADPRTGDPDEDLATLRAGKWHGLVWGHGLADGRPYELAGAEVFPALSGARSDYAAPAGAAAGYDWAEAVRTGLLGQCRRLTLTEVVECRYPVTPVDWNEVTLDAPGDRYRSMVRLIEARLEVFDVTGSAGVPTLALCLDGGTVAYTSGFSFPEALRDGLVGVLRRHQARADRDAGYPPAPVPPLPKGGRGPRVSACPAWSTDVAATAARLARLGRIAVAVPLDHDPGVTASIMPYLVNVVLHRV
jgi:hypothetical protein